MNEFFYLSCMLRMKYIPRIGVLITLDMRNVMRIVHTEVHIGFICMKVL